MRLYFGIILVVLLFGCISETSETKIVENETINEAPVPDLPVEVEEEPPVKVVEENKTNTTNNDLHSDVMNSDTVFPEEPFFEFNKTTENGSMIVYFFHSPGCSACRETYQTIADLEEKYPDIVFINYSLASANGSKAYVQFAEKYNLSTSKQLVPQVLVNDTIITDRFNIEDMLEEILKNIS
ncbi:thioredoxin family protein [Candidatus Micrarchaeota archaeon]|nr:thioredoxin family protein [Candidatus Micrarchaeota archaeon]MBU1681317.1 thioredoxin family protein [Candidatus Micrarchaeota archaeon]